jgi:environmental stress-induced protein Ves
MNAIQLIHAEAVAPQAWRNGGGQTRELLAWPTASDWRLRISRADIAASGPFSAFPGVQRWFVVLSGQGVVLHMPTPDRHALDHVLLPGHTPLHFDGGLAPGCTLVDGATQDLNLMARGGQAGMLAVEVDIPAAAAWQCRYAMAGLYTACAGHWTDGHQTVALPAHSLLWLQRAPAAAMHFTPAPGSATAAWWLGFTPETSACSTT